MQNILFENKDTQAKLRLVDFGFARILPSAAEHLTTPCFTLHYAAPEVLESDDQLPQYNEQCDLWSLGVILVLIHFFVNDFQRSEKFHHQPLLIIDH